MVVLARSRKRLREAGRRRADHPVWGGPGWKVFLDHPDEVHRIIRYIRANPEKIGQPIQRWAFVKAYGNWLQYEDHSPNSPYAKALRAAGQYP